MADWIERFWPKVRIGNEAECWEWQASTNQDGYGRFRVNGKKRQAHHVAFFLKHGRWPNYVLHSCDNPPCCNPAHLKEGTHAENIDECWNKGRGRTFKFTHLVPRIRELISAGKRNRDICRELGVKNDAVSRIRHGQIYGENSRARA